MLDYRSHISYFKVYLLSKKEIDTKNFIIHEYFIMYELIF